MYPVQRARHSYVRRVVVLCSVEPFALRECAMQLAGTLSNEVHLK